MKKYINEVIGKSSISTLYTYIKIIYNSNHIYKQCIYPSKEVQMNSSPPYSFDPIDRS